MATEEEMREKEVTEKDSADPVLARLRRIEGQVRGIHRMLSEGRVCEDVLTQLLAVRSGLDQVALLIMDRHIQDCLLSGLPGDEGVRNLQQALRNWMRFGTIISPDEAAGES